MKTLSLRRYACFSSSKSLQNLNHLVEIHSNLMPHQVASATGCSLNEAMAMLIFLFTRSLAEVFLLVYHNSDQVDPPTPILARSILEGLPDLPITCDVCGKEIEHRSDLSYDFLFKIIEKVRFVR